MEATSAPRTHGIRISRPRRLLAALSDERLVEHVRRGEAAAFEILYDRYSAGILGFCRHMLGSASDAEDAVQHTFIAAHADIERSGDRQLHVKAWLYTIARNRCLSMLRARREQVVDDVDVVERGFEHDVEHREDLRALVADVQKLPGDQREALVLAELGGLSHDEIAAVVGCEPSKVKSLVFQARTALIDRRTARETPCDEIREQIATLRGGALRRSHLRHHIDACPGCAQFREQVRRQRAMLALALPVIPSAALRSKVLGGLGLGGSGGAAAATAGVGSGVGLAAQTGLAKLGIAAVALASGGGAAVAATGTPIPFVHHGSSTAAHQRAHDAAVTAASHSRSAAAKLAHGKGGAGPSAAHSHRHGQQTSSAHKHGFTPTLGQSNGDAAKQFALTRGKGKHSGILKSHTHGRSHTHHVAAPRANSHAAPTGQAHQAPLKAHTAPSRPTVTDPAPATQPTHTQPTHTPAMPTTPKHVAPAPQPKQPVAPTDTGTTGSSLSTDTTTTPVG